MRTCVSGGTQIFLTCRKSRFSINIASIVANGLLGFIVVTSFLVTAKRHTQGEEGKTLRWAAAAINLFHFLPFIPHVVRCPVSTVMLVLVHPLKRKGHNTSSAVFWCSSKARSTRKQLERIRVRLSDPALFLMTAILIK